MGKKLITACLGLVALAAFALSATASASPVVTHPTGTALATGTKLTATNLGKTLFKNGTGETTLLECTTARLTGTLIKNKEGHIEANVTTATFLGGGAGVYKGMEECKGGSILPNATVTSNGTDPVGTKVDEEDVTNGTPYCLTAGGVLALNKFTIRGGTCSEEARKITFILDTTPFFSGDVERECKYERTAALEGTFTTDTTGDAILSVEANEKETGFTGEPGNNVLCPSKGTLEMKFTVETDAETTTPVYISKLSNMPEVTHPTGTALATGTKLLATSIGNAKLKNGEGTTTLAECTTARLTGALTKNAEGTIEGNITTATFSGPGAEFDGMSECSGISILPNLTATTNGTDPVGTKLEGSEDVANGTPYCIRSTPTMAEDEFQVRGGTCSEEARKITFILDTTKFFEGDSNRECKYERAAAIIGTFTTDTTGDAILSVEAGEKTLFTGEPGNNVLCPSKGTLEMKFTVETDAETTTPVYISQLP
jgi:hypothetical protein